MIETIDTRLARIEEIMVAVRGDIRDIKKLTEKVHAHDTQIALLKRDKKWESRMVHMVSGAVGACFMGMIEWFHRK